MTLVLRDVLVVDPEPERAADPLRCDLLIDDDGRIAAHAPPGRGQADHAIDASGLHATPGLVDAHVHLCFDPSRHPEQALPGMSESELHEMLVANGEAHLRAGVTTVRDLGSRGNSVRRYARSIAAGAVPGPRVLHAGPVLTVPGGHCFFVGDQIDSEDDLMRAVDEHIAAGDHWIKIMVTGGAMTSTSAPGIRQFDNARTAAVVRRAAAGGVPVAAHALTGEGGAIAIAAGARSVEHGIGLAPADLLAMRENDQALVPVLSPSHELLRADPDGAGDHVTRLRALIGTLRATAAEAIALGVTVLAGTDAGCPAVPHGSLVTEIKLMCELGMSPVQALAAATVHAARTLGLAGAARLTPGAPADVLLVDSDPRDYPNTLSSPAGVLSNGRIVAGLSVRTGGTTR